MLTVPTGWVDAVRKDGARVVGIVSIDLPYRCTVDVTDYSALAGSWVTTVVTIDGVDYTEVYVEGVHWSRGTSNEMAAGSIASAIASRNSEFSTDLVTTSARNRGTSITTIVAHRSATAMTVAATANEVTVSTVTGGPALFCTGPDPVGDAIPCVASIDQVSESLDPITRNVTAGDFEIVLHDSSVIDVSKQVAPLTSCGVTVWVGVPGFSFPSEYLKIAKTSIKQIVRQRSGSTIIQCHSILTRANQTTGFENGFWIARRPLWALRNIANVLCPDLIDASTLDDDDYADISHFVISNGDIARWAEKDASLDLIDAGPPAVYRTVYTPWHEEVGIPDKIEEPWISYEIDCWPGAPSMLSASESKLRTKYDGSIAPVPSPMSLSDVTRDFGAMLRGTFRPNSSGAIEYVHYDLDASASLTIDVDCETMGLEVVSENENVVNVVNVQPATGVDWVQSHGESISLHGEELPVDIQLPWVFGRFHWQWASRSSDGVWEQKVRSPAKPGGVYTNYIVPTSVLQGVCGTYRWQTSVGPDVSQSDEHKLQNAIKDGTTRCLYLKLPLGRSTVTNGGTWETTAKSAPEIIAVDRIDVGGTFERTTRSGELYLTELLDWEVQPQREAQAISNFFIDGKTDYPYGERYELHIANDTDPPVGGFVNGRCGFSDRFASTAEWPLHYPVPGVDPATEDTDRFYYGVAEDVTIPIHVATSILDRFAYGCPVVRFDASVRHLPLQVGDVISLMNDTMKIVRIDDMIGADTTATWEVTRVRRSIGDKAGVEIECTLLKRDPVYGSVVVAAPTPTYFPPIGEVSSDNVLAETDEVLDSTDDVVAQET